MKQAELRQVLSEFAGDRLALLTRHEAGARVVSHYDFNNAYQFVVGREETQIAWLEAALAELGAALPPAASELAVPVVSRPGKTVEAGAYREILADEARLLDAFVNRWQPRVAQLTHARHRAMLSVILGEALEHKRLFEQAAGGSEDLLGRRTGGVARQGAVLPTRWVE